ncbi:hypothetical protein DSECCO2_455970 [anaerobic digester metagenome]
MTNVTFISTMSPSTPPMRRCMQPMRVAINCCAKENLSFSALNPALSICIGGTMSREI